MKSIYTLVDGSVFRLHQDVSIPTSMTLVTPGTGSAIEVDSYNKILEQTISINTITEPAVKSNRELYTELTDFLKRERITEIFTLQNFFKIYVDYSLYDGKREIEHSAIIRPINPIDQVLVLGVATNNESVYRRVKTFDPTIEFRTRSMLPHGIMDTKSNGYTMRIHGIAIFQDKNRPEVHKTLYEVPYTIGSPTLNSALEDMIMIWSSEVEGIRFKDAKVTFTPRVIRLRMEIVMANMIEVYSDSEIKSILRHNMEGKYPIHPDPIIPPDIPGDPGHMIPPEDDKRPADGSYRPNRDGYFDYYERCNSTTPDALLVVESNIPDGNYEPETMIRKWMVQKDIPDIQVGEYVIYRESVLTTM